MMAKSMPLFFTVSQSMSDITYEELIRCALTPRASAFILKFGLLEIKMSDITYEELIQPLPSCKDSNRDSSIVGPYL